MHRPRGTARRLAPSLIALAVLTSGVGAPAANADPGVPVPSRAEVDAAVGQADVAAMDLATVRGELAAVEADAAAAADRAAQAAEAYNGARWRAQQAERAAEEQELLAARAAGDAAEQREAYAAAVRAGYEQAPTMTALSSLTRSNGIENVLDRTSALRMSEQGLDDRVADAEAAARVASAERTVAEGQRLAAADAAAEAESARDLARATSDSAAAQAAAVADRRDQLIGRAAELQGISLSLAAQRQAGLEARAAARAQSTAEALALSQTSDDLAAAQGSVPPTPATPLAPTPVAPAPVPAAPVAPAPVAPAAPAAPATPAPAVPAAPAPAAPAPAAPVPAAPAPAAASADGGAAAVAFARQQLGEPYVWAADGPNAWDCSGLTMAAWAAGGKTLPHYSVAQYDMSTPVAASDLQPGDLVYWGSSSDPGSIYHVALYAGDDMIIHAPRTGRPVVEESIYYWRLPDFYARP